MRQLYGIKLGMARVFDESGEAIGVTVVEVKPTPVVQVKTKAKDGYEAIQVGLGEKRKSLFNKPQLGHFGDMTPMRYLRELRLDAPSTLQKGEALTVDTFKVGDHVDVTGISKGLGFQGAVRRHNFGGGPVSHGQSDRTRAPGSVGASSYPSRTFRGQRMAGRMGNARVTVQNLDVVAVRPEDNLLLLRGAVPGKPNGVLLIRESIKGVRK
ncbi:MAG: 50S ribosomal protein L3 [candidate division Zixibacteria bacterium]|nr:50S ribosomal protein L3 [candidate division Zixibacteria bacterium]